MSLISSYYFFTLVLFLIFVIGVLLYLVFSYRKRFNDLQCQLERSGFELARSYAKVEKLQNELRWYKIYGIAPGYKKAALDPSPVTPSVQSKKSHTADDLVSKLSATTPVNVSDYVPIVNAGCTVGRSNDYSSGISDSTSSNSCNNSERCEKEILKAMRECELHSPHTKNSPEYLKELMEKLVTPFDFSNYNEKTAVEVRINLSEVHAKFSKWVKDTKQDYGLETEPEKSYTYVQSDTQKAFTAFCAGMTEGIDFTGEQLNTKVVCNVYQEFKNA